MMKSQLRLKLYQVEPTNTSFLAHPVDYRGWILKAEYSIPLFSSVMRILQVESKPKWKSMPHRPALREYFQYLHGLCRASSAASNTLLVGELIQHDGHVSMEDMVFEEFHASTREFLLIHLKLCEFNLKVEERRDLLNAWLRFPYEPV
jgi:hypothetical protein